MAHNNKKYKWCTSCNNNGNGEYVFHCKDGHNEWGHKQEKKSSVCFLNPANNAIVYYSYPITTSEEYT